MKMSLFLTVVPLLCTTPALAQSMDNSMPGMKMDKSMPGMSMPAQKPVPKPAPKAAVKSKAETGLVSPSSTPSVDKAVSQPLSSFETAKPTDQPKSADAMAGMDMSGMADMHEHVEEEVGQEPAPAPPKDHAADKFFDPVIMASERALLRKEHGGALASKIMLNLGEYQVRNGENGYRWDGEAWFGGDINRLVVKSEGEGGVKSGVSAGEVQALYSRAISPYFDVQTGLRYDFKPNPKRTYATIGLEGVAPYWFETESALFLSDHGELLGRLEGSYDLRLSQRWILQPRAEINLAAQDIREIGIGSGVSNAELGLRLRYEIRREFAPYIGLTYDRKFGGTADFARARGEDVEETGLVLGVRAWF